jgi:hypothetical protein
VFDRLRFITGVVLFSFLILISFCCAFAEEDTFKKALFIDVQIIEEDNLPNVIPINFDLPSNEGRVIVYELDKELLITRKTVDDSGKSINKKTDYICLKNQTDYIGGRSSMSGYFDIGLKRNLSCTVVNYDEKACENDKLAIFGLGSYKNLSLKVMRNNEAVRISIKTDQIDKVFTVDINNEKVIQFPYREINLQKYKDGPLFKMFSLPDKMRVKSKIKVRNLGFYNIHGDF